MINESLLYPKACRLEFAGVAQLELKDDKIDGTLRMKLELKDLVGWGHQDSAQLPLSQDPNSVSATRSDFHRGFWVEAHLEAGKRCNMEMSKFYCCFGPHECCITNVTFS